MAEELTVLAVDSLKARLTLAHILAEHVPSAGVACYRADGVVLARVGAAGTCREEGRGDVTHVGAVPRPQ